MRDYWDAQADNARMVTATTPRIILASFNAVGDFLKDAEEAGIVLDVGPGCGTMVKRLENVCTVEVVDISSKVLAKIDLPEDRKHLNKDLPKERYSLAFSHLVFQHIPEPMDFLFMVYNALKPNGIFYMQFNANMNMKKKEKILKAERGEMVYTTCEVSDMFMNCGFVDIETKYDENRLWGYIKARKQNDR